MIAVCYIHKNKMIHRNIKPENIMMVKDQENKSKSINLSNNFNRMQQDKDASIVKLIGFGSSIQIKKNEKLKDVVGSSFYIAPEVLAGNYDEKCDIWSCGVILYIMLSGNLPYNGRTDPEVIEQIKNNEVSYEHKNWKLVSNEAKDIVKHFLERDPVKRWSADKILEHRWFSRQNAHRKSAIIDPKQLELFENIKQFSGRVKLQQVIAQYIQIHFATNKDQEQMRQIFQSLDQNFDGVLTKDELMEGLNKMGYENPDEEAARIFEVADINKNGKLEFVEWCAATMDK